MNIKQNLRKGLEAGIGFVAITTLVLAGCGGGSSSSTGNAGGSTSTSATITPYKGMFMAGATVVVKDANGNPVSLTSGGTVNASGVVSVTYAANVTYPLIVEVSGSYYNEVTGLTETTATPIRGLITNAAGAANVPVTIVTEAAVADLQNRLGSFAAAHPIPAASAVAALNAAGTLFGVPASAVPAFDPATNKTSDSNTLLLSAWAVTANAQSGVTLADRVRALANSLIGASGVAPNTHQTAFNAALTSMTSGASSVMAASATPPATPTLSASIFSTHYASAVAAAGSGSGGGTGGTNGLTCNTAHYSANSVHLPTSTELASFAKTYTGNTGTFGTSFTPSGTASMVFSSSGGLTYNGTPQTVNSVCADNTVAMLYVEFGTTGHIDLFSANGGGFSGSLPDFTGVCGNAPGCPAGGGASLPVRSGGFNVSVALASLPANLAGTYDVAIYTALPESGQAASSVAGYLGLAKLVVRNTSASNYALELKTPNGTLISRNTNDPALTVVPSFGFQLSSNGGSVTIGGSNGTALPTSVTASFGADGTITGNASGNFGIGMIAFRNNITHFGPAVPAAFTALAGNWTGSAQATTCGQPPVTLSIASDSSTTINGQPNLNCVQTSYATNWDGNDDYIIPNGAGGYRLVINANQFAATVVNSVITGPGPGALTLLINDALSPTVISDAQLNYGSGGYIQSVTLTKQATSGGANAFPNEAITLPTTRRDPVSSPTIAATDLSSVGGSYTGTTASYETNVLVSDYTTGTMLNSCTLSFAANRTVTLTSGVHTYTQVIDGTNNDYWSPSLTAGEVNTGNLHAGPQTPGAGVTEIGITIGRGKVLSVTADIVADPFTPLTPMTERLTCWMPINRTPGTAGAGWTQWLSYGSASDMPTTVTGTYTGTLISANNVAAPGGSTCQLVVATDGTATFSTTGATTDVSFSAQIAGDKEDRVGYTDASNWNLRAKDISNQIDGTYNVITLQNIAGTMMVTAGQGTVRPLTSAGYACTSVIKQ